MKKFAAALLTMVCCFAMGSAAYAYSDVSGLSDAEQQAIRELSDLKIIEGYIDGTFRPEDSLSRAEFAKIAGLAMQERTGALVPETAAELKFSDVVRDGWYVSHISGAVSLGLMQGDAEGTFRPNDVISRSEVVTVLMRVLGYDDPELGGTWPNKYLNKAREIGLYEGSLTAGECSRADAATLTATMLKLPLAEEAVTDPEVAVDDFGLITALNGHNVTMYSFESGQKTWKIAEDCEWSDDNGELCDGMMINYQANAAGMLLKISREDIKVNALPDAMIADGKITLGGKKYTISDDADVLLMNSAGGVSSIAAEKVIDSIYVASLRSSRYQAPLQYVLSGNTVVGLVIGDYGAKAETMFGYLEYYGEGADGTVVQFYGDDTYYLWDYVGKGDNEDPQYDVLYAYDYDADGIEAYEVAIEAEQIGKYSKNDADKKDDVVTRVGAICQAVDANGRTTDFIVTDETVIISVEYEADGKTIKDAEYVDEVEEGDIVRVRYAKPGSDDTGIEAGYIIIDATDK